jgi:trans-aconitate methyltransferase
VSADDDEIIGLADPNRDQYFLSAPDKLALLVQAAGIRPTDHVVEIGAGIGSVARALPPSATLTLIEIDKRLTEILRKNAPRATVIQGDAFSIIQSIRCDVLLSNLPTATTQQLIGLLPALSVRTAVLATGEDSNLEAIHPQFLVEQVATVGGSDFMPPQPSTSRLVKLTRRSLK